MKGLANYTVKSLRANKVRTLVTVVGVALAAALVCAVFTTFTSLAHFLYEAEASSAGTWMAVAETADEAETEAGLARVEADTSVTGTAVLHQLGYAELTQEQQNRLGLFQAIASVEGDEQGLLSIQPADGRMPRTADEIMLFSGWRTFEGVQLGSQITLPVGQLVGEEFSVPASESSITVTDFGSEEVNGTVEPHVEGAQERTFTVVGFYDKVSYALSDLYGTVALTAQSAGGAGAAQVFMSMAGAESAEEVERTAEELFPDARIELHTALLRYMGIASSASIWSTFYGLVCVLVGVIMLACVSLIFNAFNISVAERIRQFGLLSSVGATRGQLRRAVLLEACLVAVAGIPLGLLLGLGGCWVTFACLGPSIADLAGAMSVPFEVSVDGRMLVLSAALTLLTVLVSAWVPAARASRMNIIDAIRTSGAADISKRGAARAQKAVVPERLWKGGGAGARLFGVGGKLAHITRKRSKAKGRAASVSLALAVVLLMTAGSLSLFLSTLLDAVSDDEPAAEVAVTAQVARDGEPTGEPLTAAGVTEARNASMAAQKAFYQDAFDDLAAMPNALPVGWRLSGRMPAVLPADVAGSGYDGENVAIGQKMADGSVATEARVFYVEDGAFDAYAESLGLDAAAFHEAGAPRAIGIRQAYGNDGQTYQLLETLAAPGNVTMLTAGVYDGTLPVKFDLGAVGTAPEDRGFVPYLEWGNQQVSPGEVLSMADVEVATTSIEVAAIADEPPAIAGGWGESAKLIVPMSLADELCLTEEQPMFRSFFNPMDGDHAALAQELNDAGHAYFQRDGSPVEMSFVSYNDYRAEADSNQMLATVVNVFCLLFTGILALIALANVFNTVTNSLILRRREFAVMRSVGMSTRQFRRMIADECTGFGIAGLVPGLILSVGVAYLLWLTVSLSLGGFGFVFPWAYAGIAVAMTAVAMGIAVAYGMHRCRADNVVEALRTE